MADYKIHVYSEKYQTCECSDGQALFVKVTQ